VVFSQLTLSEDYEGNYIICGGDIEASIYKIDKNGNPVSW